MGSTATWKQRVADECEWVMSTLEVLGLDAPAQGTFRTQESTGACGHLPEPQGRGWCRRPVLVKPFADTVVCCDQF